MANLPVIPARNCNLDEFENNFQQEVQRFLCSKSRKCLVLETKDTKIGSWRIWDFLCQIDDNLTDKYRGEDNQLFVHWSTLINEMQDAWKLLPKLTNLVVVEICNEDLEKESLSVMKKLMERLNLALWKKAIFISRQVNLLDMYLQAMPAGTFIKINEFEDKIIEFFEQDTLLSAAAVGDANAVLALLKNDIDNLSQALHLAVERGHKEVASLLIDKGADVNASHEGSVPLEQAALRGHEDLVVLLIENGADNANLALIQATQKGYYNIVITLIGYGVNVNVQNSNGSSALHIAAEIGHYVIAYALLKHGAEVNCKDNIDYTPLHYASSYGRSDIVKALLGMNAVIDPQTREGKTPLDFARQYGHDDVVQQINDRMEERAVLRQAINIIKRRSSTLLE